MTAGDAPPRDFSDNVSKSGGQHDSIDAGHALKFTAKALLSVNLVNLSTV
jgi:hypothetical protein